VVLIVILFWMKVLVVRFSSIGDIVLTSPVVRCLKDQLAGCTVHFLTKRSFLPLVAANPNIDKVYTIASSVKEVIVDLKKENYDHVIDLHHNLRTFQVKAMLNRPSSSFPKLNLEKWLLVNLKRNVMPDVHVVDRYFEAVKPLGIRNDQKGLDYFFSTEVKVGVPSGRYAALVIGAKFNTKKYPKEKVRELCSLIEMPVSLIGGPDDKKEGEFIAEGLKHVTDYCGKLSMDDSARILQQSAVVIANDTGFMHIAAAMKRPVVSLWGNTVPEFGMYPYLPDELHRIVERKDVPCRPCSKIGYQSCPKGHFNCMNLIAPKDVLKAVNELLNHS
jgi:ADP-heptose:LPS heptosyltransferase